jgi:4-hydroxy-tetrahydrodipicolinate synthase
MSTALPRFHGIIPPLVTPFAGHSDALDRTSLDRLLERLVTGGVHGVFILGTTGEGPSLSARLKAELIRATTKTVNRRTHVLVNITDTSFAESMQTAAVAAEAGADALVISPSPYFPVDQSELLAYLRKVARQSPLPVLLYQMPSHVKVNIELPTVEALLQERNIVGIKDSSGAMIYFQQLVAMAQRTRPDWGVMVGPEQLFIQSVLFGGHGAVCGGGNLQPRFFVDAFNAALKKDLPRLADMQKHIETCCDQIYGLGRGSSAFISAIKLALSVMGICENRLAEPLAPIGDDVRPVMQKRLEQLGILTAQPV